MRQAIGGTWLTGLVIVFTFLFVAFLSLSINFSKAFRVKNQALTIIEKKEGINTVSIPQINSYLRLNGYNMMGYCGIDKKNVYGVTDISEGTVSFEKAKKRVKYYYCFAKIESKATNFKYKAYYEIELFFKFNLPIIGSINTFSADGQTKDVIYPALYEGHCDDKPDPRIKCN